MVWVFVRCNSLGKDLFPLWGAQKGAHDTLIVPIQDGSVACG